jgi:hypothetical protein
VSIANGGTGQTTKTAAYDALSPTTTRGDLEVRGATNNVRLAVGTAGQQLATDGTDVIWLAEPGFGACGDGSDGVQNFDGTTVILGLTPSSSVYTLTRDIYLAGGSQLSGTAQIKTGGFRVFCSGLLTIGATAVIQWNGNNGSSNTGGAAQTNGTLGGGRGAGAGVVGAGAGTGGGAVGQSLGGTGGAGGAASGGGTGGGTASGAATPPTAAQGLPRNAVAAMYGTAAGTAVMDVGGTGGAGGTSTTSSTSGGGGGGGGVVGVYALRLVNLGSITSTGGTGGNASGAGTGAGGGGGGGGGCVIVVCGPGSTVGTRTAAGGTGGSLQGAGAAGANGSAGNVFTMSL